MAAAILVYTFCACFLHNIHDVTGVSGVEITEPQCYSRFDYEFKVVQKLADLENKLNALQTTDRTGRQTYEQTNVAFFAALSAHIHNQGVDEPIVFDKILTNYGDAYSATIGDFRAPVTGTYVFSVTLMAYSSHTTHYYYAKNGTPVSNIYVRGLESPYASSSQTAVLELAKGDSITIMNVDADESLHGSGYSTFSGFLLRESFGADNHVLG